MIQYRVKYTNMNHHRSLSSYTFISLYFYDRKLSKLQVYCQNRENKDCVKNGKKKIKPRHSRSSIQSKTIYHRFERINLWDTRFVRLTVVFVPVSFIVTNKSYLNFSQYAQREIDACSIALFGLIRSGFVRSIRYQNTCFWNKL